MLGQCFWSSKGDEALTKTAVDAALSYFDSEYNCVQSVLKSVLEHKGLYFGNATDLAAGFGGGIAFSGQQCGAISGAMMVIGLMVGQTTTDVKEQRSITHRLSSEFMNTFKAEFGSIRCDDLTGVNMSDSRAFEQAYEAGVFRKTCPKFVEKAVRIVMEMFPD